MRLDSHLHAKGNTIAGYKISRIRVDAKETRVLIGDSATDTIGEPQWASGS